PNRGDYLDGLVTDRIPKNFSGLAESLLVILEAGGLQGGGVNFDAKIRRNSTDPADLFHAHIGGMDNFAIALTIADDILQHSDYKAIRKTRYSSFDQEEGAAFENA